jgi:hypothetical protein
MLNLKIEHESFIKNKKFFVFLKETISVLSAAGTEFSCIVYVSKFHSSNIFDEYMYLSTTSNSSTEKK